MEGMGYEKSKEWACCAGGPHDGPHCGAVTPGLIGRLVRERRRQREAERQQRSHSERAKSVADGWTHCLPTDPKTSEEPFSPKNVFSVTREDIKGKEYHTVGNQTIMGRGEPSEGSTRRSTRQRRRNPALDGFLTGHVADIGAYPRFLFLCSLPHRPDREPVISLQRGTQCRDATIRS